MSSPQSLLDYYQQELATIEQAGLEFAKAYPKVAARLGLGGQRVGDGEVARLFESHALLAARLRQRIEDDHPEIIEPLLQTLAPHLLAPLPCMSVVQIQPSKKTFEEQFSLPANTIIRTLEEKEPCVFHTLYPVELLPIKIENAAISGRPLQAPELIQQYPQFSETLSGIKSSLSITLTPFKNTQSFADINLNKLRFYLSGPTNQAFELYELLIKNTKLLALADDLRDSTPIVLSDVSLESCLKSLGFSDKEGLLPYQAHVPLASRLLLEYFAFPQKFLFFEIDFTEVKNFVAEKFCQNQQKLQLYFYFDRYSKMLEKTINKSYFSLHCTPIINIFSKKISESALKDNVTEYTFPIEKDSTQRTEIYDVKRVLAGIEAGKDQEYLPLYSLTDSTIRSDMTYYQICRRPAWQINFYDEKHTTITLKFTNHQGKPLAQNSKIKFIFDLLLTNSQRPTQLAIMDSKNQLLFIEGLKSDIANVKVLMPFTHSQPPNTGAGIRWEFLKQFSLSHLLLSKENAINALRETLRLFITDVRINQQKQLTGLLNIKIKHINQRHPQPTAGQIFWRGIEIMLEVDETIFINNDLYLFGCMLDQFFSLCVSTNFFTQLIICANSQECHRWPARAGLRFFI